MSELRLFIPEKKEVYERFREKLMSRISKGEDKEYLFIAKVMNTSNADYDTVLERVEWINANYSTRMPEGDRKVIANYISGRSDFDAALDEDGYSLVDDLRKCGTSKKHFSFATKYCHHCRPNKYPIYDALNMRVLAIYYGYRDKYNQEPDSKLISYREYCSCHDLFRSDFVNRKPADYADDEGFYIDKFIQAMGGAKEIRDLLF